MKRYFGGISFIFFNDLYGGIYHIWVHKILYRKQTKEFLVINPNIQTYTKKKKKNQNLVDGIRGKLQKWEDHKYVQMSKQNKQKNRKSDIYKRMQR